mgnify:CR=1 FL=1
MCIPRRGFSLVELLVVIGVVSVLAALLLPTMEASLEQARRIHCLNNQKQVYSAACLFVTDHGDMLPPGVWFGPARVPIRHATPGAESRARFGTTWTWARDFYGDYLALPLGSTYANGAAITMSGGAVMASLQTPLYCPSGHIRAITDAQTPTGGADYGVPSTRIDYHLAGLSPVAEPWVDPTPNKCGYSVFRASRYWTRPADTYGPMPFSYDIGGVGYTQTPHAADAAAALDCAGANLIRTDGSGRWLDRTELGSCGYRNELAPLGYRIPISVARNVVTGTNSLRLWRNGTDTYENEAFLRSAGLVTPSITY